MYFEKKIYVIGKNRSDILIQYPKQINKNCIKSISCASIYLKKIHMKTDNLK